MGGVLTAQKRGDATLIRQKPIPSNPKTLSQMYQRWLYQDYISWWHTLTSAQKLVYTKLGSRLHQTGFAYWIGNRLSLLPDIALGLQLDNLIGTSTPDFSVNSHIPVVVGATPVVSVIDNGFSFDGIDDRIRIPHATTLSLAEWTIECFIYLNQTGTTQSIVSKSLLGEYWDSNYMLRLQSAEFIQGTVGTAAAPEKIVTSTFPLLIHTKYHLAFSYKQPLAKLYINGSLDETTNLNIVPQTSTDPVDIGRMHLWRPLGAIVDHLVIYNRELPAPDIKVHSERRYPL